MENKDNPDIDPRKQLKIEQEAKSYIDHLQFALQLNALLANPDNYSDELKRKAEDAAQTLIHSSYLDALPFNFRVELPADNPGSRSVGWQVIEENVFEFVASEVRRLDPGQVDFHNNQTDEWLTLYKHKVDKITPIFLGS